ncbi:oligosaccharide repeat unit polymerase [Akkermansiaceae bacterium]|nr:oligosaccharide repeat unit polymerase [Akkermansiaceae bacterium]
MRFALKNRLKAIHQTSSGSKYRCLNSPFVPVPKTVRMLIVVLAICYGIGTSVGAFVFIEVDLGIKALFVTGNVFYIFTLLFPLLVYRKEFGYCHPLIFASLFALAMMAIRKTGILIYGLESHLALPQWSQSELIMLMCYGKFLMTCSIWMIFAGYFWGPRYRVPQMKFPKRPNNHFMSVVIVTGAISLLACFLYVKDGGGILNFISGMTKGVTYLLNSDNFVGLGQYIVPMRFLALTALIWISLDKKALSNPFVVGIAILGVFLSYLGAGKRSGPILMIIGMGVGWIMRNRKFPFVRASTTGICLFMILGLLGLFRTTNWEKAGDFDFDFIDSLTPTVVVETTLSELKTRAADESMYYAVLANVPGKEDLLLGRSYLQNFFRFIPRVLWEDKPRGIGVLANSTFLGGNTSMPVGGVGEAYWNFHIPGVFIVFFLVGSGYRWLVGLVVTHPNSPAVRVIFILALLHFGPAQNQITYCVQYGIPTLCILFMMGLIKFPRRQPISAKK